MDRRNFNRLLFFGVPFFSFCMGCSSSDESLHNNNLLDLEKELDNYLKESNYIDYADHKNVFRQNRCILIVDDYKILFDHDLLKKFKADAIVQVKVKKMVKCNFDIYKSNFTITSKTKSTNNKLLMKTAISGQRIKYFKLDDFKTINYPIREIKGGNGTGLKLEEGFKLPCIMTTNTFNELKEESNDY